jgi:hypothetical protein
MNKILFSICIATLLSTTGCLVSDGGRHGSSARYERHDAVIVGPPVVVVHPPELIVRPPEVIVR